MSCVLLRDRQFGPETERRLVALSHRIPSDRKGLVPGVDRHDLAVVNPEFVHVTDIKRAERRMEAIDRGPDAVGVSLLGVASTADSQRCRGAERRNGESEKAASIHDRARGIGPSGASLYGITPAWKC